MTTMIPPDRTNRIRSVSIQGFRSLKSIENLELPQLTVLIGGNGAGKSTLIRFFEMLSWMLKSKNLQEFVMRHGGGDDQFFMGARQTPRIHAELCLDTEKGQNDFRFDLVHLSAGDTVMVMNEAYRYSANNIPTKADWIQIDAVGKESSLLDHSIAAVAWEALESQWINWTCSLTCWDLVLPREFPGLSYLFKPIAPPHDPLSRPSSFFAHGF
jgi:predicted ATPase